jgi:hypothetical protein
MHFEFKQPLLILLVLCGPSMYESLFRLLATKFSGNENRVYNCMHAKSKGLKTSYSRNSNVEGEHVDGERIPKAFKRTRFERRDR